MLQEPAIHHRLTCPTVVQAADAISPRRSVRPAAASSDRERGLPTHGSRRRFSERTTGPPWNLTFADAAAKVGDGDSGRSRAPTDDRDNFETECLHPMVTNWRYRPSVDIHRSELVDAKQPIARRASRTAKGACEASAAASPGRAPSVHAFRHQAVQVDVQVGR